MGCYLLSQNTVKVFSPVFMSFFYLWKLKSCEKIVQTFLRGDSKALCLPLLFVLLDFYSIPKLYG